jgi:hypothetical protein
MPTTHRLRSLLCLVLACGGDRPKPVDPFPDCTAEDCHQISDPACWEHCYNERADCGETGIDCGGECGDCFDPCAGHCINDAQDCGETGTDCGGECGACVDPCANHCDNGSMNCGETGVDCGGECGACAEDDADFIAVSIPSTAACNSTIVGTAQILNTGTSTWTRDDFKLGRVDGSDLSFSIGDPNRVWLPTGVSVPPGESHTFEVRFRAEAAGTYSQGLRMVHESVGWFGDAVTATIDVSCEDPGGGQCTSENCGINFPLDSCCCDESIAFYYEGVVADAQERVVARAANGEQVGLDGDTVTDNWVYLAVLAEEIDATGTHDGYVKTSEHPGRALEDHIWLKPLGVDRSEHYDVVTSQQGVWLHGVVVCDPMNPYWE